MEDNNQDLITTPTRYQAATPAQHLNGEMLLELIEHKVFAESRLHVELLGILRAPGLFGKWLQARAAKSTLQHQTEVVDAWTAFCAATTQMVRTQADMQRARFEYARLTEEDELKRAQGELEMARVQKEVLKTKLEMKEMLAPPPTRFGEDQLAEKNLELDLASLDADIAELRAKTAGALYRAEHAGEFVRPSTIVVQERPKPTVEQVRKRKVARQRVADDDQLELKFDRVQREKEVERRFLKLGFDEDEAKRYARELMDAVTESGTSNEKTL